MLTQKVLHGWRVGFVFGSGMFRVWFGKYIFTFFDKLGPMKAN